MAKPTYGLGLIKGLMKDGSWGLTETALDTATELGFDDEDVYDCVVNYLEETHFYKTMQSTSNSRLMQDVYHIVYGNELLYVKLQMNVGAVVVSFKAKDD
jgi:motility quorum-sensing regulator / GCU-specific mRNA interferase toxin